MGMGCYLDTYVQVEYFNGATGTWEATHFREDGEQGEYEQFLRRWGYANMDLWGEVKTYVSHAQDCLFSGCPRNHVDMSQPTG